ncbi:MAG: septal ring lytic transglycosylase RlpA family protein [Burkholderiales bacterium]|nr:septal ring lytic transglycosylase RlpA family protein [Burkholderiales bacterium]
MLLATVVLGLLSTLSGCGSAPRRAPAASPAAVDVEPLIVRVEAPLATAANRPYRAAGREYVPDLSGRPYRRQGLASWYGSQYQGQRTASGEPFDLRRLSAAHPTLPIPSYARVTNLDNGAQIIVRINDRGPFRDDRIIDLSLAGARLLGFAERGTARVDVEALSTGEVRALAGRPAPIRAGR